MDGGAALISLDCRSGIEPEANVDGRNWLERATYWTGTREKAVHPNKRRDLRAPLVLSGHGISLRVNHGALAVRNGFTHYPQEQDEWHFFRGDQKRPSRIVVLGGNGRITLDVLSWLSEQDIPLIQLDYRGRVVTALGAVGRAASPALMQAQISAAGNPKQAMKIASWIIREKINRSLAVLRSVVPNSQAQAAAIEQLQSDARLLAQKPAASKQELLGIEGRSAQFYFRSWYDIPIRWKATNRRPVPDEWHRVGPRTSARNRKNHWASHPVHAMLNYGYAVLESRVRTELVSAGLDLTTGFMHAIHPNRPALVLDIMEPGRPLIDRAMLKFVMGQKFAPADFTITSEGVCRLHPELARRLVSEIGSPEGVAGIVGNLVRRIS